MIDYTQRPEEIKKQFITHIQFIKRSADSFDQGYRDEAQRIAVSIRVLIHDTRKSTSVIKQLRQGHALFYDSATDYDPYNLFTHSSLIAATILPSGDMIYSACLDDHRAKAKYVNFDHWWNTIVFVDTQRNAFSRRDIVLYVTNQDGGVHVDPKLDAAYAQLTRHNSLGWQYESGNVVGVPPLESPHVAAVRQIGHEILKTFVPEYGKKAVFPKDSHMFMDISVQHVDAKESAHKHYGGEARKNAPCPCGSGYKYGYCCGAKS